jgi:hypothetical protein
VTRPHGFDGVRDASQPNPLARVGLLNPFLFLINRLYLIAHMPSKVAQRLCVSCKDFGRIFRRQGSWSWLNAALAATAHAVTPPAARAYCRLRCPSTAIPTLCAAEIEPEGCAGAAHPSFMSQLAFLFLWLL